MNSYKKAYNSIDAENFSIKRERALFNALIDNAKNESIQDSRYLKYFYQDAKLKKIDFLEKEKLKFKAFHANQTNQNKNKVIDENQQLANIQAELEQFFRFKKEDFFDAGAINKDGKKTRRELSKLDYEYLDKEGKSYPSPRARFLIWKYNNLFNLLKEKKKLQPVATQQPKEKESKSLTLSSLKQSFDIFKKIVDSMDDLWSGIASHIFPRDLVAKVTPYLMGAVVGFIHMVEAINGGWIAFKKFSKISSKDYVKPRNEAEINKKSADIVAGITGTVASVIGTAGVALSFTAMALASAVLASMLPVLMVGIIGATLIRRGVRYHHAEMNYFYAKNEIKFKKNDKGEVIKEIIKGDKEKQLAKEKADLENEIQSAEEKAAEKPTPENRDKVRDLYDQYFKADHEWTVIKRYEEKYKDKEFTFWFNVAELGAALTVAIGVVVGTAASFGTLSSALGGIGVAVGMGTKVLESANENYNLFNRLKSWFGYGEDNSQYKKIKEPKKDDNGKIYDSNFINDRLKAGAEKAGLQVLPKTPVVAAILNSAPAVAAAHPTQARDIKGLQTNKQKSNLVSSSVPQVIEESRNQDRRYNSV